MNKYLIVTTLIVLLTAACGGNSSEEAEKKPVTKEGMIADIKQFEDSIKQPSVQQTRAVSEDYADRCLAIYHAYPKSEEAPQYLDKAHMIYTGAGLHGRAVVYADTLIRKYPAYKNRPMVLQSLASTYDLFVLPRNTEKVKYYYNLLLEENPGMPEEEKENIRFRIAHADLTFEQLIELQTKELTQNAKKK